MSRLTCTACQGLPQSQAKYCHECKGLRYLEQPLVRLPGCTGNQPVCPIYYDPMVDGWECRHCGDNGPL